MARINNNRIFANAGIVVSVKVGIGPENDRAWEKFDVDPDTGVIQIPQVYLYGDVQNEEGLRDERRVQAFELEVGHEPTSEPWVLVSSRDADNQYPQEFPGFGSGHLKTYHFPACSVVATRRNAKLKEAENGCGPVSVFTTPKSQSKKRGINRVEAWVFRQNGFIGLFQVLVTTFDDGKTFRVVGEWRGQWTIHQLPEPRPYKLQVSPMGDRARMQQRVFGQADVQQLLSKVIFVPGNLCTGFDNRIEVLEILDVQRYIEANLANYPIWATKTADDEPIRNFTARPDVEGVTLTGNRGTLEWFSHGMAGCGMGMVKGADGVERQVRYHCFADVQKTAQGTLEICDGDIIEWDHQIDMGTNPQTKEAYPAMLVGVRVQLLNVGGRRATPVIDSVPTPKSAAA